MLVSQLVYSSCGLHPSNYQQASFIVALKDVVCLSSTARLEFWRCSAGKVKHDA
jgi:hypothetical protein